MDADRVRHRLSAERPYKTVKLRIPLDVLAQLKALAPTEGCHSFRTLLKMCIGHAMSRVEAQRRAQYAVSIAKGDVPYDVGT